MCLSLRIFLSHQLRISANIGVLLQLLTQAKKNEYNEYDIESSPDANSGIDNINSTCKLNNTGCIEMRTAIFDRIKVENSPLTPSHTTSLNITCLAGPIIPMYC